MTALEKALAALRKARFDLSEIVGQREYILTVLPLPSPRLVELAEQIAAARIVVARKRKRARQLMDGDPTVELEPEDA